MPLAGGNGGSFRGALNSPKISSFTKCLRPLATMSTLRRVLRKWFSKDNEANSLVIGNFFVTASLSGT